MTNPQQKPPRELTGRAVLFWLVGFFALVFGVNAVMVKAATSTFGGVETTSSYKAGLKFKDEIAAAERQAFGMTTLKTSDAIFFTSTVVSSTPQFTAAVLKAGSKYGSFREARNVNCDAWGI